MSVQTAAMSVADETRNGASGSHAPFSDAVVAKADAVLKDAGLRRSGKGLQSTEAADLSRQLSGITRERRELRLEQKALTETLAKQNAIEAEISKLNLQDGELNLQLARVAGLDITSNNRIVALINAIRSQTVELRKQLNAQQDVVRAARSKLNQSEEKYAEAIFQARKRVNELSQTITSRLKAPQVQIAIDVVHANFEVPKEIDATSILRTLDNRLREFEKEVFQETIPLDVGANGSLFTMVSVNQQAIRMVIDSGATLITLPADVAQKLQVTIPDDAPVVPLVLANGGKINGRRVLLETVRVGQFEAKNVAAVVLEPIAANAEPLLGLSFLDRYKFELDSSAKTLGLLRIEESDAKSP
ncbi:retropepsin-like aspartic protease family protein [Aporhodopirellula aestuarii]|uniref:TIGR02281 family clan AA aspartic protease n=1 Tax=Aporhodopirellula aestuarii TaxID=2950107 RepID=A0ABT0UCV7_9BACT|nr:TIGR02281 family clan AA aspartic protease [Aporhodopirellula aestuarii]MCM2374863.1 TIGR02281 family clan AA aspartic protease [Aporhodopirellula aestuarii]